METINTVHASGFESAWQKAIPEVAWGTVALFLATLLASASYIAAPAAIRNAIPEADIGLAMLMSLGITFPFNVIVGIPLYHALI